MAQGVEGWTVHNRLDLLVRVCVGAAITVAHAMQRGGSIADEIAKLNDLKKQGVISATEFEPAKAILMGT